MPGNQQANNPTFEPQAFGGERLYPRRPSFNFMLARSSGASRDATQVTGRLLSH